MVKTGQIKDQKKRSYGLAVFWLVLILVLLSISVVFRLVNRLGGSKNPFLTNVGLVIRGGEEQIHLVYIDKSKIMIASINPEIKLTLTRGFGEYRVDKIYPLGELYQKGNQLLYETISHTYKIPLVGVIPADAYFLKDKPKDNLIKLVYYSIFDQTSYNLTTLDKIKLYFKLLSVKNADFKLIDNIDQEALSGYFAGGDEMVINENHSVEVINNTDHFGLATDLSAFLEKNHIRVVRVDDLIMNNTDICRVNYQIGLNHTATFKWIRHFLNCSSGDQLSNNARADFQVMVGEGYWHLLEDKW